MPETKRRFPEYCSTRLPTRRLASRFSSVQRRPSSWPTRRPPSPEGCAAKDVGGNQILAPYLFARPHSVGWRYGHVGPTLVQLGSSRGEGSVVTQLLRMPSNATLSPSDNTTRTRCWSTSCAPSACQRWNQRICRRSRMARVYRNSPYYVVGQALYAFESDTSAGADWLRPSVHRARKLALERLVARRERRLCSCVVDPSRRVWTRSPDNARGTIQDQ
uniref:Uncharacterized protein n=1 Tax=Mycena chlorophos TaxID=658473 RepID=A0ABQ0L9A1_MYCCL|nr:predicted protein [Mycena chlorophos]